MLKRCEKAPHQRQYTDGKTCEDIGISCEHSTKDDLRKGGFEQSE